MQSIGEKIYNLRKQKGLSQEELGFEIDVSRQTVSKWESNAMQPNLDNIKNLCTVFNVSLNYFIDEDIASEVAADNGDIEEYQASESVNKKVNAPHKSGLFLCLSIISTVLFILSSIICIIIGQTALTSNTGNDTITNFKFDISTFIICMIVTIIFLSVAIIFWIKTIIAKKRKM